MDAGAQDLEGQDVASWEGGSVVRVMPPVQPRKLAKVPFVEMADGRLQGVVSSGSDASRVYVSSVTAATHGFSCSTNNNRPCGGLGGNWTCNHIDAMVAEAELQYGRDVIVRYLRIDMSGRIKGQKESTPAAVVFSRFLRHLAYLEIPDTTEPMPELHWFPAMGAVR